MCSLVLLLVQMASHRIGLRSIQAALTSQDIWTHSAVALSYGRSVVSAEIT